MKEVWKDIPGYEGLYQASTYGRIRSLPRATTHGKIRKLSKHKSGYLVFSAWKQGKPKYISVHRAVAEAFIPNPNGYQQVNHKDEIKTNNQVNNLEWCTPKYNTNYGTGHKRATLAETNGKGSKQVLQIKDGNVIHIWESANECQRHGFNQGYISACCRGEHKKAYGFEWKYLKKGGH